MFYVIGLHQYLQYNTLQLGFCSHFKINLFLFLIPYLLIKLQLLFISMHFFCCKFSILRFQVGKWMRIRIHSPADCKLMLFLFRRDDSPSASPSLRRVSLGAKYRVIFTGYQDTRDAGQIRLISQQRQCVLIRRFSTFLKSYPLTLGNFGSSKSPWSMSDTGTRFL